MIIVIRSGLWEGIPVIKYWPAYVLYILHGGLRRGALRALSSHSRSQRVAVSVHLRLVFTPHNGWFWDISSKNYLTMDLGQNRLQ